MKHNCYDDYGDNIVAEIFPDEIITASLGQEKLIQEIAKIVDRVNMSLGTDRQISNFLLRSTLFSRTSTGKIIRKQYHFEESKND